MKIVRISIWQYVTMRVRRKRSFPKDSANDPNIPIPNYCFRYWCRGANQMNLDLEDIDTRVIDQRIGIGVGGHDTVIRLLHKPTGIIIEIPRLSGSQHKDRQLGLDAIDFMISGL